MSDPHESTRLPPRQDPAEHPGLRQAGEDLRSTAREARRAAGEAASSVAAEASAAAGTLKQEGAALLDTAQQRASETAQQGVRAGAEQAQGVARAIHRAAEELEGQSPQLARTIHDAAGAIDDMARSLRDRSPAEMLRGAEDFARRQPLAFFGAAALAGFAIARFARSSASHREASHGMRPASGGYAGAGAQPMAGAGSGMGMGMAGTSATGDLSAGGSHPHGSATPHDTASGTAAGAPGWIPDETGTPRPATLASASLGGAVSYRPRGGSENG